MITINMPDGRTFEFKHVVFDYNGTLAEDGITSNLVKELLRELAAKVHVAVITADTFGIVREQLQDVEGIEIIVIGSGLDGTEKARYVQKLGSETTIVIGNGVNDQPMFFIGGLKIAVIGPEGASSGLLAAATIVVKSPEDAIRLLLKPKRLIATLRC
ncbi:HAD family hydrolase [Sporomusa acidovorans]|uniref:Haloacid dehalogenase-like hydrolase n=1 Tax=Sporomusa acidovorans (strain ATCC 49682 / DSM 3132 / Mol) TaxID=1123286 RepID=A0ABZ3IXH8_SPOA4|nr:HAD family hydrolase [Sporomusa acidovorans]OZC22376.1 haloacid dehalogenase-like hydrolase [Sporomusa acidovorans DSM 3132]SDE47357.1 Soluble P-type ATPase [Sporomusa acidovorans]